MFCAHLLIQCSKCSAPISRKIPGTLLIPVNFLQMASILYFAGAGDDVKHLVLLNLFLNPSGDPDAH